MRLYNTLSRSIQQVKPVIPNQIGLYACGFTVYDYTHLGHLRKYTMDDVLIRTLKYAGYQLNFVQNVTDVGHLSSDSDTGEDKLEKGAKKYGKTVWDIAKEFERYFFYSMDQMGNLRPDISCRATDHISEQLELVKVLEQKGYAYVIEGDGVYFDTARFSEYGKLARLDLEQLQQGARVESVEGKRNHTDFALWKFERVGENRAMVWESPWHQRSFPGWHIECSAMAMKYLSHAFSPDGSFNPDTIIPIDIHTGGIDHIPVHHTNEIAQAEAASEKKPFVECWVHHNHLHIDGQKMSKSLGNFFTIDDVKQKGFEPQALRLLFLTTHYRSEMNFTWENLKGSQATWNNLSTKITQFRAESSRTVLSEEKANQIDQYRTRFFEYLFDDLRTPEALAVLHEVVKSNIPGGDKYELLVEFDSVLGLGIGQLTSNTSDMLPLDVQQFPDQLKQLLDAREQARKQKKWDESDKLRFEIEQLGYKVLDTADGVKLYSKK